MQRQQAKPGSDGLPAIVQGRWSRDKLHFVEYFMALFNGGMKNLWRNRAYVDLFAGPGICLDRYTGGEFEGSPLLALRCQTPFTHLIFNDINGQFIEALRERQGRLFPTANVRYHNIDCNIAARSIRGVLPDNTLILAFIDSWGYDLTFDSLADLAHRPTTDLIVTFHTGAIKRNAHRQIAAVDKALDDPTWRGRYEAAKGDPSQPPTMVLINTFRDRLADRLGYTHFGDPEVIRNTNGSPMFYLLFASRHPRGRDFWEKASAKLPTGQRRLI